MVSKIKDVVEPPSALRISAGTSEAERSTTWVAPRDLRRSVLCKEAVATIGENPDSLAS